MKDHTTLETPRISASSYSNTAPLIWSFLYGSQHGRVELILDNAPARSAELLASGRVDAALVPVIAYHEIENARLIRNVCVGAREKVRSVCLVTRGGELSDVRSVALDISSRTSIVLTKIIFRQFLGFEPEWRAASPDIDAMLSENDAALLIGDPALAIAECGSQTGESKSEIRNPKSQIRKFDLAQLWKHYTGMGFVFAMWMTSRDTISIDFAAAKDEGLKHLDEIASNYSSDIGLNRDEMIRYLSQNISYSMDDSMNAGMKLYFELGEKCGLIESLKPTRYLE